MGNLTGRGRGLVGFCLAAAAFLSVSCSGMPKIAGLEAPVGPAITAAAPGSPQYRDLADLPQRPTPPDSATNQETVQSLTQERAKVMDEGERLRSEPFATPEPGMRVPVEQ